MTRYEQNAWTATGESGLVGAIALAGAWKYGDAAPYSVLQGRHESLKDSAPRKRILKFLGKAGLYDGQTGLYLLSADSYEEGGALTTLVDETEVLEPKTGAVHVPLLDTELEARDFLEGRGFKVGRSGITSVAGQEETYSATLMTRKK